jgi:uncharacterized membrane protein YqgA involved in biofilm formation
MIAYIVAIILAMLFGWGVILAACFAFTVPLYWPIALVAVAWFVFIAKSYWGGPLDD